MFDYQIVHNLKMLQEQPDLDSMVRLFLDSFSRSVSIFNPAKFFKVLLSSDGEQVLGSTLRNIEVRLYFICHRQTSGEIFVILVMNSLNWKGSLQTLYLSPFIILTTWLALRKLKKNRN